MNASHNPLGGQPRPTLGPALRRAWVGYQQQLDDALSSAGFRDRAVPDGRILRMCRASETTISGIGRELGVTRQAASKLVASLRARGYVTLRASSTDAREKVVRPTARATAYLDAHRRAVRTIDRRLRREIGDGAFTALYELLDAVGRDEPMRLRDYLRSRGVREV